MVFTLVNAVMIRNIPLRNLDSIVAVNLRDARNRPSGMSMPDFEDYQRQARIFAALTLVFGASYNTSADGCATEQFIGTYMSTNLFPYLGSDPVVGRCFTARSAWGAVGHDDLLRAPEAPLRRRSVRDRSNGQAEWPGLQVVGVVPEGMQFSFNNDIWVPMSQMPPAFRAQKRDVPNYVLFERLNDAVSVAQATAEMSAMADQLAKDYPTTNKDFHPVITPY